VTAPRPPGTKGTLYPTPNAGTSKASQAFWSVEDVDGLVVALQARGVVFEEYDIPGDRSAAGAITPGLVQGQRRPLPGLDRGGSRLGLTAGHGELVRTLDMLLQGHGDPVQERAASSRPATRPRRQRRACRRGNDNRDCMTKEPLAPTDLLPGALPAAPLPAAMTAPNFASLGLSAQVVHACAHAGFELPTPIQADAIPAVLRGHDVLALAPTGSGKTAAFALPLLQRVQEEPPADRRRPRVLVLVPTRELAAQVGEVFRDLARFVENPPRIAVVFGGVSVNPQMMGLRGGADVVVATPGRLLDLVAKSALQLSQVQVLVLDEADRLLDLGFADEVERVLALLPQQRQNLLFSATFARGVQALADDLLRDAVRVEAEGVDRSEPAILQRAIAVDAGRRTELLRHLVRQEGWRRVLVFVATRYATEHLARKLCDAGIPAVALHGEQSQGRRSDVLEALKAGQTDVLVTTDLAARGIDVPGLEVVVNYDLPRSPTHYVHRIGRTGRAGATGVAVSFVSADTEAHLHLIETRQGRVVAREEVAGFEPVEAPPPSATPPGTGGVKGKRPSKKDKLRAAAAKASASGKMPPRQPT
jgi:superfamily II DNA/RNA helicase